MKRLIVSGMLGAAWLFVAAAAGSAATEKHVGMVTAVAGQQITIEELGPWRGPETRPTSQTFRLTSGTRIVRVERTPEGSQGWPWSYTSRPLSLSDLTAGDYVTVTVEPGDRRRAAIQVESVAVEPDRAR